MLRIFGRRRRSRDLVREIGAGVLQAQVWYDGGVSDHARTFKANIGHRTVAHLATLHAIVIADDPEEAAELLLRWSSKGGEIRPLLLAGDFFLTEITPTRKGVY
jgi:antirestriction protein ArdC